VTGKKDALPSEAHRIQRDSRTGLSKGDVGENLMGLFLRCRWCLGSVGVLGSCLIFLFAPAAARAGGGGLDEHGAAVVEARA